eukprot:tig00001000_g6181.t1
MSKVMESLRLLHKGEKRAVEALDANRLEMQALPTEALRLLLLLNDIVGKVQALAPFPVARKARRLDRSTPLSARPARLRALSRC